MSQEDKEQAEKLWKEQARGRAYMGVEHIGDEVKSEAEWYQEALGKVLDAPAKKIRICASAKRWWNGKIDEKSSQLGREKRRRRRSAATAQPKTGLQKSIPIAKDRRWNDALNNLKGDEVWRAMKFANPRAGATLQALTNTDGNQANTITEIEEILRRVSFSPNQQNKYLEQLLAGPAHPSVTVHTVKQALFSQCIGKVPGLGKLSF